MNVAVHQKKEKNEETGKGEAGEERKQATYFKRLRAALLRSFRRQHGKNDLCERQPGVTGTLRKVNNNFDPTQMGSESAPIR